MPVKGLEHMMPRPANRIAIDIGHLYVMVIEADAGNFHETV
jgi:hypothetical protein